MTAELIDGKAVAAQMKADIEQEIAELKEKHNSSPCLMAVQVGENAASASYTRSQKKGCEKVGINYQLEELPADITEQDLVKFVEEKGQDKQITGIILQMPLPEHIRAEKIQAAIASAKDIEGIKLQNLGALLSESATLAPCTAAAVMELIRSTGVPFKGKEVVIVGHSSIVGKPLALLLLASPLESATTTVCHIATKDLSSHTLRAEILIVAAGKPDLVTGDMVKEGAIVIDVGINRIDGKLVGDVSFDQAKEKASLITPVPGGVGPVTTAMLLKNALNAWKLQLSDA